MSLKTLVKVGEVNNLSDARYCAGMGAEYIGFQLDEDHDKFVDFNTFKAITGWIEGVKYIGEFENSTSAQIFEKQKEYQFEVVQISNPRQLDQLGGIGIPKILKLTLNSIEEISSIDYTKADYLLLESNGINELSSEDINTLKTVCTQKPTVLGFGFSDENINEVLEKIKPLGISLKGSDEIRPGYKDYDELADIFEAIEVDEF